MLDPPDECGREPFWPTTEFQAVQPRNDLLAENADLHAGKRGTEAEVLADAQSEVGVRRSIDAKLERFVFASHLSSLDIPCAPRKGAS